MLCYWSYAACCEDSSLKLKAEKEVKPQPQALRVFWGTVFAYDWLVMAAPCCTRWSARDHE